MRFEPVIATGDYYLWVFLYMEGGGEWQPVSGVDYVAHTDEMITFDGSPKSEAITPVLHINRKAESCFQMLLTKSIPTSAAQDSRLAFP